MNYILNGQEKDAHNNLIKYITDYTILWLLCQFKEELW